MKLLLRLVISALATALAVWLVPGIYLIGSSNAEKAVTLLVVAAIFGVVNAIVRPFVTLISACLVVLTLGLFLLVINALMLMLAAWLAGLMGFGFVVDGFWAAIFGSLMISIATALLYALLDAKD